MIYSSSAQARPAALTACNRGKKTGVISNPPESSKLWLAESVSNYPGMSGTGSDIVKAMRRQLEESDAEVIQGRALSVVPLGKTIGVAVGSEFYETRAVIVAAGISRRPICPGETEFLGRGVSYCATCDGMLYRDRPVAAVVLGMLSWLLLSKMFRNIVNFIRKKLHKCIKKIIIK